MFWSFNTIAMNLWSEFIYESYFLVWIIFNYNGNVMHYKLLSKKKVMHYNFGLSFFLALAKSSMVYLTIGEIYIIAS